MITEANRVLIRKSYIALVAVAVVLGGCKGADSAAATPTTPAASTSSSGTAGTASYVPKATAGVPIQPSFDIMAINNLSAAMEVTPRRDPFALTGNEKAFDLSQLAERLNQETGSTELMYTPPEEETSPAFRPTEPQPYRRLSGVLVGDSVLGILVSSGAESGEILRPGQNVPGTDFTVVSIDEEKMVLHRDGSVRPNTVIVRLEQAPPGFAGAGGGGAPGAGGSPLGPKGGKNVNFGGNADGGK